MSIDISKHVAPKSDQLNADDLVGGPMLAVVTSVKESGDQKQPIWIYLDGYPGRPWKPCLTQRRVLLQLWGKYAEKYVGRTVEFFRDPNVVYGGEKVGGIRVQALSDITKDEWVVVSESQKKRTQYLVKRLDVKTAPVVPTDPPKERGNIESALSTIEKWTGDTAPLKAKLNAMEWSKEDRVRISEALKGKK
jgi:hypothetical protein